jgi:hypothetical protein
MTNLPNAAAAHVAESKVRDYLLNSGHPQNGGKSAYFKAFGFAVEQWTMMRDALVEHATVNRLTGTSRSPHGTKHTVRCSIRIDGTHASRRCGSWTAIARLAW